MRRIFLPALVLILFASTAGPLTTPAAMAAAPTSTLNARASPPGRVNLNTADAETLKRELSGVGLTKATAIVKHRQTYGPFESVEELLEVTGIGKTLLDRNREKLRVD
jgi:competence protein ComEA